MNKNYKKKYKKEYENTSVRYSLKLNKKYDAEEILEFKKFLEENPSETINSVLKKALRCYLAVGLPF